MYAPLLELIHGPDGQDMADAVGVALAAYPDVAIERNPVRLPPPERPCLLLFLLTPGAAKEPAVLDLGDAAAAADLPRLPVVPELSVYTWTGLPPALAHLAELNAMGWDQGAAPGERVLDAVLKLLGLRPFKDHCKLFISYRRVDGGAVAQALHRHFSGAGWRAFMDTEDIEGGARVQSAIHAAIPERDFLLLVNSPTAHASEWVREEVEVALHRRVTVLVVDLPGAGRMPLLRDLTGLLWEPADPAMARRVEQRVAARVAARAGFDQRLRQTLSSLCRGLDLDQAPRDRRRVMLRGPGGALCLLDWEDAPHGLDRLFRLHQGYAAEAMVPSAALLVHNGLPLSARERAAIDWATDPEPLHVLALEELAVALEDLI